MLDTLVLASSSGLAVCVAVLALAKRTSPITFGDARVMWVMHKKTTSCRGHKWKLIKRRKDKIVGFRCECGYSYTQKRPLVCRSLKLEEQSEHPAPFLFE